MTASLNLEEGKTSTSPPHFNGQFYSWWKTQMHDFLILKDNELWDIVLDGPHIPTMDVKDREVIRVVPKTRQQYNDTYRRKIEKNFKVMKLLVCGIGDEEYKRILACESTKEN
ncbi:hypothetical protein MTR67_012146 [Solanum verrucosum]|uniref:DUF4219 domain-containing protein n=1 Tax=Solanum verrucosum TaxID=315347 RepID=A0AAF0QDZ1_SOLVR|nr:hypothetical protein MTR67_012146 [Solanum verrucosum]